MKYINIGKIVNTHGIKGECKIQSYSDFDSERYKKGNCVYVNYQNTYIPLEVETYRTHKGFSLVSFKDYQNINLVEQYKNCNLYILEKDRKPLPKGQYYRSELIGLQVYDTKRIHIGSVIAVEETKGAQNNIRIKKEDGNTFLIPYIPSFILEIRKEDNEMMIHMDEGLL